MGGFFTRERFGRPQFLAGLLLLAFLAQCAWLVHLQARRRELRAEEILRVELGMSYWGKQVSGVAAFAPEAPQEVNPPATHSRLWYLIAGAPLWWVIPPPSPGQLAGWVWLLRVPYLLFGVLLGASLWYVARRLYGNAGGYIALALYCFSPGMLRASTGWLAQPEVGTAWGAFGAIFNAIAVAHTLYAPREVVLWNWRRIVLLGLALALAVGSQYSVIVVVPVALAFMFYVAPGRRSAALAIWGAGCGLGLLVLVAAYSFRVGVFTESLRHASFFGGSWRALVVPEVYRELSSQMAMISPALVLAVPAALIAYLASPRTRYFGNTAPLLVASLFVLLGLLNPHDPGLGFRVMATPFLFVFVAGVSADLLESRYRNLVQACLTGLLVAYALWNGIELVRIGRM